MTAANRNKQTSLAGINSPKDFFPTDERLCDAVVKALIREKLLDTTFGPALEPSCGPGNWIKSLRKNGYKQAVIGVEKFDEVAMRAEAAKDLSAHIIVADFLEMTKETLLGVASNDDNEKEGFGLIIGNPPFTLTSAFIRHALTLLKPDGVLAFVLGVGYFTAELERDDVTPRRDWLWGSLLRESDDPEDVLATPRQLHLIMPRPSFQAGKGTDSATYVVAVWVRPWSADESKHTRPVMIPLVWRERGLNAAQVKKAEREKARSDAQTTLKIEPVEGDGG